MNLPCQQLACSLVIAVLFSVSFYSVIYIHCIIVMFKRFLIFLAFYVVLDHSHQGPRSMGSRYGVVGRGSTLARVFYKVGTKMTQGTRVEVDDPGSRVDAMDPVFGDYGNDEGSSK